MNVVKRQIHSHDRAFWTEAFVDMLRTEPEDVCSGLLDIRWKTQRHGPKIAWDSPTLADLSKSSINSATGRDWEGSRQSVITHIAC